MKLRLVYRGNPDARRLALHNPRPYFGSEEAEIDWEEEQEYARYMAKQTRREALEDAMLVWELK